MASFRAPTPPFQAVPSKRALYVDPPLPISPLTWSEQRQCPAWSLCSSGPSSLNGAPPKGDEFGDCTFFGCTSNLDLRTKYWHDPPVAVWHMLCKMTGHRCGKGVANRLWMTQRSPGQMWLLHPRKWRTRAPVLTGGPGAAPGGVASKNGWVYMRVQGGFISYSQFCVSVCVH